MFEALAPKIMGIILYRGIPMRLISWLISLPVFAAVIVFILQNRMQVTVSFWPFDAQATLPVSILSLGVLILGFVMGSLVTGVSTLFIRLETRRLRKEVSSLQEKLQKPQTPLSCEPTILYKGRYQNISTLNAPAPRSKWARWFGR